MNWCAVKMKIPYMVQVINAVRDSAKIIKAIVKISTDLQPLYASWTQTGIIARLMQWHRWDYLLQMLIFGCVDNQTQFNIQFVYKLIIDIWRRESKVLMINLKITF